MSNTFTNVHNVHFSYGSATEKSAAVYGQEAVGKFALQRDTGVVYRISAVSAAGAATYTAYLPARTSWQSQALVASDAAAGMLSWQNTTGVVLLVTQLILYVTTATTGACTGDFGVAATNILNDKLLDGLDMNAASVLLLPDSHDTVNNGTNGKPSAIIPVGGYLTGSVASGASAGLVGTAFWSYIPIG